MAELAKNAFFEPRVVQGGYALRTRAVLGNANAKKINFEVWLLPIKLDYLNLKMRLLSGFGAAGRHRKHLQITKLYFYSLASGKPIGISQKKIPGDLSGLA